MMILLCELAIKSGWTNSFSSTLGNEIGILASVSFWSLLIIESVARVSQHVLFTHELLVKQVSR